MVLQTLPLENICQLCSDYNHNNNYYMCKTLTETLQETEGGK